MVKKNKLVRANWYVFENQMKAVKREAKRRKQSESEIIRGEINYLTAKEV